MIHFKQTLDRFILQAHSGDLKTATYPKEYLDLRTKVSFGMGAPARVPWIGFLAPEMSVSNGINPVYLYYKNSNILVLAYGVSETTESKDSWPVEVINSVQTITAYLNQDVPRYGDSFVFKAYKIEITNNEVTYKYFDSNAVSSEKDLESDLSIITDYYKKMFSMPSSLIAQEVRDGLFYMEKQLEDFLIFNWENSELGKKYDLIVEDGELISQQYRTDIGPIDILAIDKKTKSFVVVELKRNQTSDDTVGQLARYMGWIKEHKKDANVRGVIIAGQYDKKLDYAREMIPNIDVFIYKVDFRLSEFRG